MKEGESKANSNSGRIELFDCMVHLAGSQNHSVPRLKVTAAEMDVIRVIHGDDAVRDIKPAGSRPAMSKRDEQFTLARHYNPKAVKTAFPEINLSGFEAWLEETLELERMERDEKAQARQDGLNKQSQAAETAAA